MWLRLHRLAQASNGFAQAHGEIHDGSKPLGIRDGHTVFMG